MLHLILVLTMFQSAHPRGVRWWDERGAAASSVVSIRAPAGGAMRVQRSPARVLSVSIRAPAGGAIPTDSRHCHNTWRFNPRTRGGCDWLCFKPHLATKLFQSAHPRGVRSTPESVSSKRIPVSIRAPAGGAIGPPPELRADRSVSIRAPAGGAIAASFRLATPYRCFNPRTRGGCDDQTCNLVFASRLFQSAHPRGVRFFQVVRMHQHVQFQSAHPRGVRWVPAIQNEMTKTVSIRAPAGGAIG